MNDENSFVKINDLDLESASFTVEEIEQGVIFGEFRYNNQIWP